MELDAVKKLISKYITGHGYFVAQAEIAERYYNNDNDIHYREPKNRDKTPDADKPIDNPMRTADNKIALGFYPLLVDQKSAYMFTAPPVFDAGNKEANEIIVAALGDSYAKNAQALCVSASNAGVAWVHYWKDGNNKFRWAPVPAEQIIPVWSPKLDHDLLAVLRTYKEFDDNGDAFDVYEYWTEKECQAFRKRAGDSVDDGLTYYPMFAPDNETGDILRHDFGRVPFIPFRNNAKMSNDLDRIKQLIDAYDKTYSGYMDDLEDVQEVIFVLTNYGDADLKKFLEDLKYYKTISVDNQGGDDKSGVSTLTIDIPVEAREKMLELTRKMIFTMGQGVDPEQQGLNQTSGEAMKFVYSLLELKAGKTETEFKLGFNELIRAILQFSGKSAENIIQTWTRTSIKNDSELVEMCSKSTGIISRKTILLNHPFVEDAETEEKQLEEDAKKAAERMDIYKDNDDDEGEGGED